MRSRWASFRPPALSLQLQIALATFLPLVVFVVLAAATVAYALRTVPRDLAVQRQTALAQVAAAGVAGNLAGDLRLLQATAGELSRYVEDPDQARQLLFDRANILSVFNGGVGLLDTRGTAIAVTPSARSTWSLNFSHRDYFREVMASGVPVFSALFEDQPSGQPAVVVAVPVTSEGVLTGVLVGEFRLTSGGWAASLDLLQGAEGRTAYLVDSSGAIIYHPDRALVAGSLGDGRDGRRQLLGDVARSGIYRRLGSREEVVISYARIPGMAWGLVLEEPWQPIESVITRYRWLAGGLMALGLGLALLLLVLMVGRVTRPLKALVAEAGRVAEGLPFQALEVQGPPDLRTLLHMINRMVARLAEQQQALREYALQVLRSQEEERLRLSRDLHDETVQELVALSQRLELLGDVLDEPNEARTRLLELRSLAGQSLAGARRLSNDLRPFILEDLGLAAALRALTRDLVAQLPEAQANCEVVGEEHRLPPERELTAFRIAQEALANVRKHAHDATRVNVSLIYEDDGVHLLIEDDGPGFVAPGPGELLRSGHLGLTGMRERAALIGGELEITSVPGEGTTVSLRLSSEEIKAGAGFGSRRIQKGTKIPWFE